jgi:hypothetical protein
MKYLTAAGASVVLAVGAASAVAQAAQKSVDVADSNVIHGFNVVLVLGEQQGGTTPDTLPNGPKKALADMRDFLPFKSYRLLDSQWILCCAVKYIRPGVSGRLRGVDEQQYSFSVDVLGVTGSKLSLRFELREEVSKKTAFSKPEEATFDELVRQQTKVAREKERADVEARLEEQRKRLSPKHPTIQELEMKLEQLKWESDDRFRAGGGAKAPVIDSTFSMDVGETVVIGTSSLKGDKALIALLTAARRPGSQSSTLGEKR